MANRYVKTLFEKLSIGQVIKHLNVNEILNLKIPFPPLHVQREISEEVKNRLNKAKKLKEEAKEELENAKLRVEKIILG